MNSFRRLLLEFLLTQLATLLWFPFHEMSHTVPRYMLGACFAYGLLVFGLLQVAKRRLADMPFG